MVSRPHRCTDHIHREVRGCNVPRLCAVCRAILGAEANVKSQLPPEVSERAARPVRLTRRGYLRGGVG